MRATSNSNRKIGNLVEEAKVGGDEMHIAKTVYNRPSSTVDLEKGELHQYEAPALLENLISCEIEADELKFSKELSFYRDINVFRDIIVVLLLIYLLVREACFVGVAVRGNYTTALVDQTGGQDASIVGFEPEYLQVDQTGGQDASMIDFEPFEDFEGVLSFDAVRVSYQLGSQTGLGREPYKEVVNLEDRRVRSSPSFGR